MECYQEMVTPPPICYTITPRQVCLWKRSINHTLRRIRVFGALFLQKVPVSLQDEAKETGAIPIGITPKTLQKVLIIVHVNISNRIY